MASLLVIRFWKLEGGTRGVFCPIAGFQRVHHCRKILTWRRLTGRDAYTRIFVEHALCKCVEVVMACLPEATLFDIKRNGEFEGWHCLGEKGIRGRSVRVGGAPTRLPTRTLGSIHI